MGRPVGAATLFRRANAEYKQLRKMANGQRVERNQFLLGASPRQMEERGWIVCVERWPERHRAWYRITPKGKAHLKANPQPPSREQFGTQYIGSLL